MDPTGSQLPSEQWYLDNWDSAVSSKPTFTLRHYDAAIRSPGAHRASWRPDPRAAVLVGLMLVGLVLSLVL